MECSSPSHLVVSFQSTKVATRSLFPLAQLLGAKKSWPRKRTVSSRTFINKSETSILNFFHLFSVYSDKIEKKGIFDRLELETNGGHQTYETVDLTPTETRIKVTGLEKPASSVFARLGGIKPLDNNDDVVMLNRMETFTGILKRHAPKVVDLFTTFFV